MPELPEIEVLKNSLKNVLPGKIIDWVKIIDFIKKIEPKNLPAKLKGQKVIKVSRRQKMIIFELSGGNYLVTHLKMTGQYVFKSTAGQLFFGGHGQPGIDTVPNKYTRVIFYLKNDGILYYGDLRKFGWLKLLDENGLAELSGQFGVEPLSRNFSRQYFNLILERYSRKKIKLILMDQFMISGIGNIYAAEILFKSGVRPDRPAGRLSEKEKNAIFHQIKRILTDSIKLGGTAVNTYPNSNSTGGFNKKLRVYDREGQPCFRCKARLRRVKFGGRSTVYCPECQK
ncbi:MAG: bifunctional DNA-formamidopyrimidine glycosylase/DNA-(apurinic or apyrimidinic site) lyase [Patescibacteria group bacterium]